MRIALLSCAVPWAACPTNGLYNISQAKALSELGAQTEIFSVAPWLPRFCARIGGAVRRQIERPSRYSFEGVHINTVRVPAAYPRTIRHRVVPWCPGLVSRAFQLLAGGPLESALRSFRPTALLVHGTQPWASFANSYARKHGVPVVFIEHSQGDVLRIVEGGRLHRFIRDAGAHAHATLAVNDAMVQHLQRLAVPRADLILNGVNTLDSPAAARAKTSGKFRILCAGAYYPRKGHIELIRGLARARLPDVELVLVGAPSKEVERVIAESGIASAVSRLPLLSNRELLIEMARSDLFALPSWSEAFGLVFMEALGAGTPVLLTNDSGAATHIEHRKHGWVVPPRNVIAIAEALREAHGAPDSVRRAMGSVGQEMVHATFGWRKNAAEVLNCLRNSRSQAAPSAPKLPALA